MYAGSARLRHALFSCLLLAGATACNDDMTSTAPALPGQPSTTLARISVTNDLITLRAGERATIELPGDVNSTEAHAWTSDNAQIAQVDADGTISGLAVGTTTITVSSDGKSTDVLVTVLPAEETSETLEAEQ
jgi:hypothetical protein